MTVDTWSYRTDATVQFEAIKEWIFFCITHMTTKRIDSGGEFFPLTVSEKSLEISQIVSI